MQLLHKNQSTTVIYTQLYKCICYFLMLLPQIIIFNISFSVPRKSDLNTRVYPIM